MNSRSAGKAGRFPWVATPVRLFGLVVALLGSCTPKTKSTDPREDAGRSPNATILPAPLASAPPTGRGADLTDSGQSDGRVGLPMDSRGRPIPLDAGPPKPEPFIPGRSLVRDRITGSDIAGVTLSAEWHWADVPSPPPAPELSKDGLDAARKATRRLWRIDIAELGRLRVIVDSPSFSLTKYTELRARSDRYGHLLLWPNGDNYRIVPPGALRALLDERRIDVTPLLSVTAVPTGKRGARFGFPTETARLSTSRGQVTLEQATSMNVGTGGPLLCRLLVELAGAKPSVQLCEENKVPVQADFVWPGGSRGSFSVASFSIRTDFPGGVYAVPPPAASFAPRGLPPVPSGIFLSRDQIAALRTGPADLPSPRTDPEANGAPGEGFIAVNHSDALRFVLLDGVAAAWVPAHGRQYIIGTTQGHYTVQWRSFLGTFIGEPRKVAFPARVTVGRDPEADAAAPVASAP